MEIYNQTVSLFNLPLAAVLALIQLGFTLLLTVVYTGLSSRLARPLSLRPRRYTQQRLVSRRARLLAGLYLVMLLGLLTLPLLALVTRSFLVIEQPREYGRNPLPGDAGLLSRARRQPARVRCSMFHRPRRWASR